MEKKIFDILPPEEYKTRVPITKSHRLAKGLILFLFILVFVGGLCYFRLPRATVEVWPERETLSFQEKIIADTETYQINISEKIIPARIFEVEEPGSEEFPTTGKSSKEAKAQGTIRVFNDYHRSQTLIFNTRFQPPTENILYFRTTKKIVVPAKGYVDVEVIADKPGPEYNIEPATFSVPGLVGYPQYTFIYGKSSTPMKGGVKADTPIVLEEDLEKAKNILTEKLFDKAESSLWNKVSDDFVLFEEAKKRKILETASSFEEGEESQSFTLDVKVKLEAVLFKKSDLEGLAKAFIISQLSEEKSINENTLKIDFSLESVDPELKKISLDLKFQALVFVKIDETVLIGLLKGKPLDQAKSIAENLPKITKIEISTFPFWVKKVPSRVELKLNVDSFIIQ